MIATLLDAFAILPGFDHRLIDSVGLSLFVSLNALMGLPSFIVGVQVYLALSRSGPLRLHGLLFLPAAMVVTQSKLVVPLIAAVSRQIRLMVVEACRTASPSSATFRAGD